MIRRWPDATLKLLILTIYAPVAHKPDAVARLPGMSYTLLSHFAKSSLRCTRLSARSNRLVRYLASLGHSLWYSGTVLGCGRRSLLPMTLRCVSLYSVPTPCLLHWPWPCRVFRTSPGHLTGRLHEALRSQISGHSPSPTYEDLLPLLRTTSSLSHSTFYLSHIPSQDRPAVGAHTAPPWPPPSTVHISTRSEWHIPCTLSIPSPVCGFVPVHASLLFQMAPVNSATSQEGHSLTTGVIVKMVVFICTYSIPLTRTPH